MEQWNGTQYPENVLNQILLFSCGVPRLLQHAFNSKGDLSTTIDVAVNEMTTCLKESYGSAGPFLLTQRRLYHWFFARLFDGMRQRAARVKLHRGHLRNGQWFSMQEQRFHLTAQSWFHDPCGVGTTKSVQSLKVI